MYSESRWRNIAQPIISRVLANCNEAGADEKSILESLREAYPFGERKYHPYKIWLSEIAIQRGRKPKLGTFGPKTKAAMEPDPRQENLFGGA